MWLNQIPCDPARLERLRVLSSQLATQKAHAAFSRMGRFENDPVGFVETILGGFLWSAQRQILQDLVEHPRVAVVGCHGFGKTHLASDVACWWLSTAAVGRRFLVSTAPTFAQVRALLWRYINRKHTAAGLPGKCLQTEWQAAGELIGFGRKPANGDMTGFQGIHAEGVMIILDEACGVDNSLWVAAETLATNDKSRILAIGNPDDPSSAFAQKCKPGSGWHVRRINAFDTPLFTGEPVPDFLRDLLVSPNWVEARRREWGEDSALFKAKIAGEFPPQSENALILLPWITAAAAREPGSLACGVLGVDVARSEGRDRSVICARGPDGAASIIFSQHTRDTTTLIGRVAQAIAEHNADIVNIDDVGVGGGVTDGLREQQRLGNIDGGVLIQGVVASAGIPEINLGRRASRELSSKAIRFENLKAWANWNMREAFREGDVQIVAGPHSDALLADLSELRFAYGATGKIRMESKDDMRARIDRSPDHSDALALCYVPALKRRGGVIVA